ncbi:hypothetical protein GGH12_006132 [Coemansia sp. RSA 1822]|nr:hypothetical protein LPJ76_006229 [Coemansia sp. RSA 638]KAJ2540609.1 hypothetical protein GGF49_004315 [Coemansia sp. RSA 1853]KAJ2557664.1 hypothetical protein GGH12_006132 [Coemansia sp. RSA 1822]
MEVGGLKRKLAGAQFDDAESRKKRSLNTNGGQDSGSLCLGKRKQLADTRSTKRQRVSFDAEDMMSRLSVIEMPLSLRARAYLPNVQKDQNEQKDSEKNDSERNAVVVYSPPDTPFQLSDKVSESMDVD